MYDATCEYCGEPCEYDSTMCLCTECDPNVEGRPMQWQVGDRVLATDQFGCFYDEPCTVTGFDTALDGRPLVKVKTSSDGVTVFYPNELRRLETE